MKNINNLIIMLIIVLFVLASTINTAKAVVDGKDLRKEFVRRLIIANDNEDNLKLNKVKIGEDKFDIVNGTIVKYRDYSDGRLVVYVKDVHRIPDIQKNIINILDELTLENELGLISVEHGYADRITKDILAQRHKMLNPYATKTMELSGAYYYAHSFEAKEIYGLYNEKTVIAGAEIQSVDMEAGNIFSMLGYALMREYSYDLDEVDEVVVNKRSRIAVDKTIEHMGLNQKKIGALIFGGGHTKSIIEALEEKKVSYMIIEPNGYEDAYSKMCKSILNMKTIKIERGETSGI